MPGVHDVLQALGADRQRDGSWKLDLAGLRLQSLFGGVLQGEALLSLQGDALVFQKPAELAACGTMWIPDVNGIDALRNAIVESHGQVRERVDEGFTTLRRLGFKAKLQAPDPLPRAQAQIDGHLCVVAIDAAGELVVETVAGRPVPPEQRRALASPEEATPDEAHRRVAVVVAKFLARAASPATGAVAPELSDEELHELQAALDDSDEDDAFAHRDDGSSGEDDDGERTAAGVDPPARAGRSFSDDDDDEGTLQVAHHGKARPVATAREDDEDAIGTVELNVSNLRATRPAGLNVPSTPPRATAPAPGSSPSAAAGPRDNSLLDAFDDDDPPGAGDFDEPSEPTSTGPAPAPRRGLQPSSEEDDLIAALGGDDGDESAPPFATGAGDVLAGRPTAVNAALLPALPSAAPTQALPSPPRGSDSAELDDVADGFDDGEGSRPRPNAPRVGAASDPPSPRPPDPPVVDDFDDGKTRALTVDAALLEKLKIGDGVPGMAAAAPSPSSPTAMPAAAASRDLAEPPATAHVVPPSPSLDRITPVAANEVDLSAIDAELAALEVRAAELSAELAAVNERIAALRATRESTTTRPTPPGGKTQTVPASPPGPAASGSTAPPTRSTGRELDDAFAAVGQSADDSAEGFTRSRDRDPRASSLPSLASVDVQEVAGGEEGVSLAALQGALREMGVDVESGATQVAAQIPDLPAHRDDDGDVFGSSGGESIGDISQEATRVRVARPGTIALVVEDQKARDRLRKHLAPRFAELVEADNARSAAQLKELSYLDAIVFVRPSTSEPNKQGFARLDSMPRRPRVLVISTDPSFDDVPGVDLRLPLGQKASEVARQVLEGLERLGVQAMQV